jgi:hypothetical protein
VTPASGPSPRHGHAFQSVVQGFGGYWLLFGGTDGAGNRLADTWKLTASGSSGTGYAWTQLSPASSPSPRSGHGMRWSPHRGRVQLFGGEGPGGLLGDTWEWDGANWLPITTNGAPAARAEAALVDASTFPVGSLSPGLLIGGRDASGPRAEAWQVTSTIPATATPFGGPLPSALSLIVLGRPWVGGSITMILNTSTTTPIVLPHVIVGFSNTTSGLGPLPVGLGPAFNNLPLLVDPVALLPLPVTATGSPMVTFNVPPVPSLVGIHLYLQGIALLPSPTGPLPGWNLSAGIDCQLGWL